MSDSLQPKIRGVIDELYRQNPGEPRSFFFGAAYEALPELEEQDPAKVSQMFGMAFAVIIVALHREV